MTPFDLSACLAFGIFISRTGLSYQEAGSKMGMPPYKVSRIVTCKQRLMFDDAFQLYSVFGCDLDELVALTHKILAGDNKLLELATKQQELRTELSALREKLAQQ